MFLMNENSQQVSFPGATDFLLYVCVVEKNIGSQDTGALL